MGGHTAGASYPDPALCQDNVLSNRRAGVSAPPFLEAHHPYLDARVQTDRMTVEVRSRQGQVARAAGLPYTVYASQVGSPPWSRIARRAFKDASPRVCPLATRCS